MIDPNDYIITRKRKKYRFALFANASNCYEFEEWKKRPVDVIELGAGTALFSVELAKHNPKLHFVAVDVKGDRLQKGARIALEEKLKNISFVRARADQIEQLFNKNSVSQLWITFPDPFPKKRSSGRRLTHPTFLAKYSAILKTGGSMLLKHDNPDFFNWSLEQLVEQKWHINELTFDLQQSNLQSEYKVKTTYEQRWLEEGRTTQFVRATRPTS